MANPVRNTENRYAFIDALRAAAVLLVVVAHAGLGSIIPGGSGVTIFFTVSGFIICTIVLREYDRTNGFDLARFYARRLLKIGPPFLLIVLIPTIVYSISQSINWLQVAGQAFFLFNWQYMSGQTAVLPGSGVVWSLSIEEQFYVGFAILWILALLTPKPVQKIAVLAVACSLVPLILRVILNFDSVDHARTYYGTDTRIDGIAIGILTALLYRSITKMDSNSRMRNLLGRTRKIAISYAAFVFAIGFYLASLIIRDELFRETLRYSMQAVAAAILILYGLLREHGRVHALLMKFVSWRPVQIIGLASYSIYLCHLILISLTSELVSGQNSVVQILFKISTSIVLGCIIWALLERPVENWKKRVPWLTGSSPTRSHSAVSSEGSR